MTYVEAVLSGRSAGAPGAIAMLALAQKDARPAAVGVAVRRHRAAGRDGFTVGPRLAGELASPAPQNKAPDVIAYFSGPDGSRVQAGDTIRNAAYAATLRRIAAEGPVAMLSGQDRRRHRRAPGQGPPARDHDAWTTWPPTAPRSARRSAGRTADGPCAAPGAPSGGSGHPGRPGNPGAHRHCRARPRRSAGLVPALPGRAADVRGRPAVCRRSGLREDPGGRPAGPGLSCGAREADRRDGRAARPSRATRRRAALRPGRHP